MHPQGCGVEYTVDLGEGWRVTVDDEKSTYTVSRDSRSVTFNDFTRLPKCTINCGLTIRRGDNQITLPAPVIEYLDRHTLAAGAFTDLRNPFGPLEQKLTTQCLKRAGGRGVTPVSKRRVPIKTVLADDLPTGPKQRELSKLVLPEDYSTEPCLEITNSKKRKKDTSNTRSKSKKSACPSALNLDPQGGLS